MTDIKSLIERLRLMEREDILAGPMPRHPIYGEAADALQAAEDRLEELQSHLQDSFTEKGGLVDKIGRLQAELAEAHKECEEQARLLGISGSKEARLLAELAEEKRKSSEIPDQIYGLTLAEIREAINFANVRNTVGLIREKVISDLKFEEERLRSNAAREVAIEAFELQEEGEGSPAYSHDYAVRWVDAEIEAKMKEKP